MNAPQSSGIGSRVRAARERLGWSREELAVHSAISWSAISQVESGRRANLRPRTLAALAGALGVTIDYLVRGGPAGPAMVRHQALLYRLDEELLDSAVPFIAAGIDRREPVLAVTTKANVKLLRERLEPAGEQVEFAESETWYTEPAAALESYRSFAAAKLEAGAPWVRIVGEPVWAGRSRPEVRLWTRYESLLNLVFASWPVTILCPYDERSVRPQIVSEACRTHPHTIAKGRVADSSDYAIPGGFILDEG
jgi:transcriptional regulator with XRE-family HTH domain